LDTVLGLCVYYIFYWFFYEVKERIKISREGKKAMSTIIDYREDTDAVVQKLISHLNNGWLVRTRARALEFPTRQ
jgi:hypothetical protein